MPSSLRDSWSTAWRNRSLRLRLLVTVPFLIVFLTTLARFLTWIEQRPGTTLADPLLALFTPVDLTWATFGLIYVSLTAALVMLVRHPPVLLIALQGYMLMIAFRMIAMSLVPLEPPPTMLPLNDPLVQTFGTGSLLTKDLFFSGHTSTLFLLFLTAPGPRLRALFLVCTSLVAVCVLLQHVHYGIDVFAAPFFAYGAYRIVRIVNATVLPIHHS